MPEVMGTKDISRREPAAAQSLLEVWHAVGYIVGLHGQIGRPVPLVATTRPSHGHRESCMFGTELHTGLAYVFVVQLIGLAVAWLSRVSVGASCQSLVQWAFFAWMLAGGLATVAALAWGPIWCMASGSSLAVSILMAVWDFSPRSLAAKS